MSLTEYRRKRRFDRTPEPEGEVQPHTGFSFVVQKHRARRLHYDFRLELDGVLMSWAVPKGPSFNPKDRSLAVHVEDHPVEYGTFEGIIPEGEYGGGSVMVWDRGHWEPEDDPRKAYERGKLSFQLFGQKLRGRWTLVRMHGERSEGGKNWLLIKSSDEFARASAKPAAEEKIIDRSVLTGRTMEQITSDADRVWTRDGEIPGKKRARNRSSVDPSGLPGARKRSQPKALAPQMATLVPEVPAGDEWLHEMKFDGYRLLAVKSGSSVRLLTRREQDWTEKFPSVVEELRHLPVQKAILDGEVVVLAPDGTSDFQALQNSLRADREKNHTFYLFDLPHCEGYDLTQVPLLDRKKLLAELLAGLGSRILRYSDHVVGSGQTFYDHACQHALEGIISKQADSEYESRRTATWVKVKCRARQEFVVGGFSKPTGARKHFGALLLGLYEDDRLTYCGRVGTGFTQDSLTELSEHLRSLQQKEPAFVNPPRGSSARGVTWVAPELVVEVEFAGWTADGIVRQASFQGLREDKAAREVMREQTTTTTKKARYRRAKESSGRRSSESSELAGVRLTNPDRILYPEQGLTKRDLADYYAAIAEQILPHVAERPLTLVRCPQGRHTHCFYQKHKDDSIPDVVHGIALEEKQGERAYFYIDDAIGLLSLVQMGALELHPWASRIDRPERPDRLIFDLDPGEDVPWSVTVQAAFELREHLSQLGLESFVRTTGGKGLHVVVPIDRRTEWDDAKQFARAVASSFARRHPDRYTATSSKAKRVGKIYVDYLRNGRGATAIASYSTRARPNAPVAMPLAWKDLSEKLDPQEFHVQSVPKYLAKRKRDPWDGFFDVRQVLTKSRKGG